jgi:hypothetical protein
MTRMGKPRMGLLAVVAAALMALASAAPALATKPTGEFVNFGQCPVTNASVTACLFAQTTSGEFKIKSTAVPITKTVTLQGGLEPNESGGLNIVPAVNGETLSKTPQTVPGGLLKILAPEFFPEPLKAIFNEFINKGITGATATTELVGQASLNVQNAFTGTGTALTLPVRVHLENGFLGNNCFVGSKAHPVIVELTTGTTSPPLPNLPITGSPGEPEFRDGENLIILRKNSLVNSTFSAPTAEGCGSQILFGLFTGIIDSAVNSELGLPSTAGNNQARLSGNQEIGIKEAVIASEK